MKIINMGKGVRGKGYERPLCLYVIGIFVFILLCAEIAHAAPPPVRIKDIAKIKEARENQIMGFGLAVGLRQTGDSQQTQFTKQALTNLLNRMGVSSTSFQPNRTAGNVVNNLSSDPRIQDFKSKNVAAVMVTANLPPFAKQGQKIDVTVSAVGDATSLKGGTLLMSPLQGPDGKVYAVAQGPLSLNGNDVQLLTSARIPGGAIVEEEVAVNIEQKAVKIPATPKEKIEARTAAPQPSTFSIVLNEPDFTTAARVAYSIVRAGINAKAIDASTISVTLSPAYDLIALISRIENLLVVPDVGRAKIVINEKTGTIVIGDNIRILPVAVSYSGFNIQVEESQELGKFETFAGPAQASQKRLMMLESRANLGDLIRALNSIGASPRDLISILQAIKSAGAINADIEII